MFRYFDYLVNEGLFTLRTENSNLSDKFVNGYFGYIDSF